jgi:hypothetical protein
MIIRSGRGLRDPIFASRRLHGDHGKKLSHHEQDECDTTD